jgi:hypothetical protein
MTINRYVATRATRLSDGSLLVHGRTEPLRTFFSSRPVTHTFYRFRPLPSSERVER